MEKKKILIFTLAYMPFVGGAEIALREVTSRLSDRYDFQIVTARMKNLARRELIEGIPVRRVGFGVQSIDKLLFYPLAVLYGLFHRADIIFGLLENQAALAARTASFLTGASCIINLQSGDTEEYMKRKLGMFYFIYGWVYAKRPHYVVLSNYLKQRAMQHGVPEDHVTIIPNGVDTKTFSAKKTAKREPVIITASRLTLKNAVDDIIRALPLVKKAIPKARLVICGTGEDGQMLRALAQQLGVEDAVEFKGLVPYKDLPRELGKAAVFVRPSLSEGFGNSFIEALSCGVPIIGTNVGGIPDFLIDKKTGLYCGVRDPADLAQKIIQLLKNKKLAGTIVKNGKAMVKRYEWEIIANKFAEVFG